MPDIVLDWNAIRNIGALLAVTLGFLAVSGLPVMSLTGQNLARLRQRSSYDKCARQLAFFAVLVGWLLVCGTGWYAGASVFLAHPDLVSVWPDITPDTFTLVKLGRIVVWLSLFSGVCLLSLYAILWRSLRAWPVLHQVMGLLAALLCLEAFYGALCLVWAETAVLEAPLIRLTDLFMPPLEASVWSVAPYALPLAVSMAGGIGVLWLIARRNRDDYGRDHYRQMVPWCASWARNGWVVTWMLLVAFAAINLWYVRLDMGYLPLTELRDAGLQVALWCIPALLWGIVCRSETPMRHKLTLLLALVLALVCLSGLSMGFMGGY